MHDVDHIYSQLRQSGHPGWGGEHHSRRLEGWASTVARLVAELTFPRAPAQLLELGTGNGMVASLFTQRGYAVEGIDISHEAIDWARQLFAATTLTAAFHHGDVCAMPFDAGSFDIAIDGNCLHCLIGDRRRHGLAEVERVLRPRGVLLVSTMCGLPKSDDARAQYDAATRTLRRGGAACRTLLPAEDIAREIAAAGFQVISQEIAENSWWDHLTLLARRA